MSVSITAEFPLGVYQGHGPSGSAEPFPLQPRLYSALVHAACTGSTAVPDPDRPGRLKPSPEAQLALDWFEANPPEILTIPEVLPVERAERIVYRNEDSFSKGKGRDVRAKRKSDAFAVREALGWGWDESAVPPDVLRTLDELCADVGYLGETDSPVSLTVRNDVVPTHRRTDRPTRDDLRRGDVLPTVGIGRRHVLDRWHDQLHPHGKKAFRTQKFSMGTTPLPPASPRDALRNAVYVPIVGEVQDAPWHKALLIPVRIDCPALDPVNRKNLMVAAHRTLTRLLTTEDSQGLLTGRGNAARGRANGLALHLLDQHEIRSVSGSLWDPYLVLLIPRGVEGNDLELVLETAAKLRRVYTRDSGTLVADRGQRSDRLLDCSQFWKAPDPGLERIWVTQSPAVAERRTKRRGEYSEFDVAMLWSLANVFKGMLDEVDIAQNAGERIEAIVKRMAGENNGQDTWLDVEQYVTRRPYELVHRTNRNMPIRPFVAGLRAPALIADRTVIAVGQSRHLGGGLLVPVDVEAAETGEQS